ncbi:hypothetical protein [Ponticoccus litoralis]|uniref:Simple sugar transport system permease protein n=1 Tax=Ponticoccus litoralis TaxID=422297 RepID=A0AAW9SS67_9RHOB
MTMAKISTGGDGGTQPRARRPLSDEALITSMVACAAAVLFVLAALLVPNFHQPLNVLNLVTNNWPVISPGIGVTFLLVSGNFDLSVGGIVALSGVLAVWFAQSVPRAAMRFRPGGGCRPGWRWAARCWAPCRSAR